MITFKHVERATTSGSKIALVIGGSGGGSIDVSLELELVADGSCVATEPSVGPCMLGAMLRDRVDLGYTVANSCTLRASPGPAAYGPICFVLYSILANSS